MEVTDEIRKLVDDIIKMYKNELTNQNINASYSLANSIQPEFEFNGSRFIVYFNMEEHWKYVEEGRKPGSWPPVANIKQWIKIKALLPKAIKCKLPNGKSKMVVPTEDQRAYLIGRKIYKEGIEAKHPLQNALDHSSHIIDQIAGLLAEQYAYEIINQHIAELSEN